MAWRFPALVAAMAALSFLTAWLLTGPPQAETTAQAAKAESPLIRKRQVVDEPSLWRIRARNVYGPPAPIGGAPETVSGRLMQQACEGVSETAWQVPAGAERRDLCACVGRMIDRTPDAEGLAELTNHLYVTRQPPHPGSSAMATGFVTARIACQRGLFAALHADG